MIVLDRSVNSLVRRTFPFFFGGDGESAVLVEETGANGGESWVGSSAQSAQSNNLRGRRVYLVGDSTGDGEDGDSNSWVPKEHGETDKNEQEREPNDSSFLLLVGLDRGLNSGNEGDLAIMGD